MLDLILQLWRRLLFYLRRDQFDRDLAEEMKLHLELKAEDNRAAGLSPPEARQAAQRQFGNQTLLQEASREMWGIRSIETLFQDLQFGLRMMRRQRGFTLIAVLSLAIGIGANTAIFSLIEVMLWRLLPVKDPQQLALFSTNQQGRADYDFNYPFFERLRDNQHVFSGLIAASSSNRFMRMQVPEAGGGVEIVQPERVSGNYFSVLGVNAALGRLLNEADDSAANPQAVVVLSYDFWQRRFGLDPTVVGKKITLDDFPFTVVGIAQSGFTGLEVGRRPNLWCPVRSITLIEPNSPALRDAGYTWLKVMGRLQPGTSLAQAQAEMGVIFKQQMADDLAKQPSMSAEQRRTIEATRFELEEGGAGWTTLRGQFKKPLLILMTVIALVLLIACANIANLLLARAAARRKEIAVRLALGASRFRLLRQLLTESMLLALLGGALGVIFAQWGTRVLVAYLPRQQSPIAFDLSPDLHVLGFTLAASLLTGLLFGLAPAWQATRLDLTGSLKDQIGSGSSRALGLRLPLHKVLVITQVALSLFLLIGAGLFVRSLQNLKNIDLGFARENLVSFRLDTGKGYNQIRRANLYHQMLAKLEALPGVRAASFSSFSLLSENRVRYSIATPGFVPQNAEEAICHALTVGPNYFAAMGISLLSGREFGAQDERLNETNNNAQSSAPAASGQPAQTQAGPRPLAAVVNQALAQHFFGAEDPLGKHFTITSGPQKNSLAQIIGVVKDAKYREMRERAPRTFYLAWFQVPVNSDQAFQIRPTGTIPNLAAVIGRHAQELDPKLQIIDFRTMNERVDGLLIPERFIAQLAGFFSLFALLLACLGLYGIMSQAVLRRTREIGVRMALGARRRDVIVLVLRESMTLVVIGVVIGLGAALMTTRFISNFLYGMTHTDPLTIAIAVSAMITSAALAGYLPARKASQVSPLVALRDE